MTAGRFLVDDCCWLLDCLDDQSIVLSILCEQNAGDFIRVVVGRREKYNSNDDDDDVAGFNLCVCSPTAVLIIARQQHTNSKRFNFGRLCHRVLFICKLPA